MPVEGGLIGRIGMVEGRLTRLTAATLMELAKLHYPPTVAMHSISTRAPSASPLPATVDRAGGSCGK